MVIAAGQGHDVTTTDGLIKVEIRLLPDITKGRPARTVFHSVKLKAELKAIAAQAKCVDRNYPFFPAKKTVSWGSMPTVWLRPLH
jgi:integrase/recombinase XerD